MKSVTTPTATLETLNVLGKRCQQLTTQLEAVRGTVLADKLSKKIFELQQTRSNMLLGMLHTAIDSLFLTPCHGAAH